MSNTIIITSARPGLCFDKHSPGLRYSFELLYFYSRPLDCRSEIFSAPHNQSGSGVQEKAVDREEGRKSQNLELTKEQIVSKVYFRFSGQKDELFVLEF